MSFSKGPRPARRAAFLFAFFLAAEPGPLFAQGRGVTLYSGLHRTGESQTFANDVVNLGDTPFGAFHARSADVSRGCEAELFERRGFSGRSVKLREKDNDLGNTALGRDSVGSLRVRCDGAPGYPGPRRDGDRDRVSVDAPRWDASRSGSGRPGVTLFRDRKLTGPYESFFGDVPDLARTGFGARRASSIYVSPGCVATLYEHPNYQGRATTFREKDNNLANTAVGEDAASSLRVSCPGR